MRWEQAILQVGRQRKRHTVKYKNNLVGEFAKREFLPVCGWDRWGDRSHIGNL